MVAGGGIDYIIREVDAKLGQAALGGGIVSEDRGEGGVTERLGEALPKGLTSTGVVAESAGRVS